MFPENLMHEVNEALENTADRERVAWLTLRMQSFYTWQFVDVFVSELRDGEGRQIVQSVWLFTSNVVLEIKDINSGPNFDITPLASVRYIDVRMSDYDVRIPATVNLSSRMQVQVVFAEGEVGRFFASGTNCSRLHRILTQRLIPRLP